MTDFDSGLDITCEYDPLGFRYGASVFGPVPEHRRLNDIRATLLDRNADGPDPVDCIAMDVGSEEHLALLKKTYLLYGVVAYAPGTLGKEPVRSQGHMDVVSPIRASLNQN